MRPPALPLRLRSGAMHLRWSGVDGGPAAICIPGLSAHSGSFELLAARLAAAGCEVAALDLRGRGRSPAGAPGTHGWRNHAEDVLEAATALGREQVALVGHSMGAYVAMEAAALAPARVARLVLIDAAGRPEPGAIPPILASVERLGREYPSAAAYEERIQARGAVEPWEALWRAHARDELEARPGGVGPRTSLAAVQEDMLYAASHDPRALWTALGVPTLLLRATRPLAPGGLVVAAELRDAFLREVAGARAVDVDANHYGVMAHEVALAAAAAFVAPPKAPSGA